MRQGAKARTTAIRNPAAGLLYLSLGFQKEKPRGRRQVEGGCMEGQARLVSSSTSPVTSCVTCGKSACTSAPQFPSFIRVLLFRYRGGSP